MTTRTFTAENSRLAMQQVREAMGADAQILSSTTRNGMSVIVASDDPLDADDSQVSGGDAKTLAQPAGYSAAAASLLAHMPVAAEQAAATPATVPTAAPTVASMLVNLRKNATASFKSAVRSTAAVFANRSNGAGFGAAMDEAARPAASIPAPVIVQADPTVGHMRNELTSMRRMIERELGQLSVDQMRSSRPRALAMDLLTDFGCDRSLATSLASQIDTNAKESTVLPILRALMTAAVQVVDSDPLEAGGVVALVGPTGAGKTTTAAKLAAAYAKRHSARDIALITTDHNRAAAREQLQSHGLRLGITVIDAAGPKDLQKALKRAEGYPLVIVDTAGLSPKDKSLISQLNLIRECERVRTLLVVPANSNAKDLADLVRVYAPARPDAMILTKLDETARVGGAISVSIKNDLPIAFTADGQSVPGNIGLADRTALAKRLNEAVAHNEEDAEEHHAAA